MTTKQTETMTDIQAFNRRFENLDGWGIRINGLDGRLVEIDEYDDARELSTQGHFTYVSHDETSVTVEVGLPDRDTYREVVIPFAADGDEVERLLMGAIRECEKAEEALTAPESAADYTAAAGAWGEDALKGEKPEAAVRRLRDGLSAPVAPPKPPEVETRCVLLESTEGIIQAHNDGYTVAGKKGIWVVFYRLIKED